MVTASVPPHSVVQAHVVRRRVGLILAAIMVTAGGAVAAGIVTSGSGAQSAAPYPLNIPVAQRNNTQLTQSRLMLPAHLAAIGQVLPLPPTLAGDHLSPDHVAQVRLATTLPTLAWTTGASPNNQLLSVHSSSSTMSEFTVAALSGHNCWYMEYGASGANARYGETANVKTGGCTAASPPTSGWHSSWQQVGT
jgi:hypothetical protein